MLLEEGADERLTIAKGAFAEALDVRATVAAESGEAPLDDAGRAGGLRMLALAKRRCAPKPDCDRADEMAMTFGGFLVSLDPPRADAAATIETLRGRRDCGR